MSSGSAEPQLHPPMGCPWAKATWGAVVGTGRPGGGEAPPHPSYPLELRTTSLLLGGEDPGKWICPGGERHPPPLPRPWRCAQDVQVVCSEGGGGIGSHKYQELLYRPRNTPWLPPSSGSDRSLTPAVHTDRSTHSLPFWPPYAQPLSLPAAVHLLVPSAPVRPSICLHTFGGNLWASLWSWPNPSRPHSLSA